MSKAGKKILKGLEDAVAFSKGDTSTGRLVTPEMLFNKLPPDRQKKIDDRAKKLIEKEKKRMANGVRKPKKNPGKLTVREEVEISMRENFFHKFYDMASSHGPVEINKVMSETEQVVNFIMTGQKP